jgi:hypothetical protein
MSALGGGEQVSTPHDSTWAGVCLGLSMNQFLGTLDSGNSLSGTVTLDISQINQSGTGSMYMYCTVVKHVLFSRDCHTTAHKYSFSLPQWRLCKRMLHSWDSHMVCKDNFPPPQGERTITRNTIILIRLYHRILELYNFILHKRKGGLYSNKGQLEECNFPVFTGGSHYVLVQYYYPLLDRERRTGA